MSVALSMAAFALATSITPGPVNVVAFSGAARGGLRPALAHVSGATLGFTALLLACGAGLHLVLAHTPWLSLLLRLLGVAYLGWLALCLLRDKGELGQSRHRPSAWGGALMQWLNPKAWLACGAGTAAFVGDAGWPRLALLAGLYLVVCWLSLACWALAGAYLGKHLLQPARLRQCNRAMAALLLASAGYLMLLR